MKNTRPLQMLLISLLNSSNNCFDYFLFPCLSDSFLTQAHEVTQTPPLFNNNFFHLMYNRYIGLNLTLLQYVTVVWFLKEELKQQKTKGLLTFHHILARGNWSDVIKPVWARILRQNLKASCVIALQPPTPSPQDFRVNHRREELNLGLTLADFISWTEQSRSQEIWRATCGSCPAQLDGKLHLIKRAYIYC